MAAVAQNGGFSISDCGVRTSVVHRINSLPYNKPNLKEMMKDREQAAQFENFTFTQSKNFIKQLATELNRVIQLKFPLIPGKVKNKGTEEEQQQYIVHWAEEVETIPAKDAEEKEVWLVNQGFVKDSVHRKKASKNRAQLGRFSWWP